jgi:hypothetical protein
MENFTIIETSLKWNGRQNTTYCKFSCREGHVDEIPMNYFRRRTICTICSKNYRKHPLYGVLDSLKQRCYNPKNCRYEKYGALGITVCKEWLETGYLGLKNFIKDMGERPTGMTLDRIDVNGDYCKENCRWAEPTMQSFNKNLFCTNSSGVTGVSWCKEKNKWTAQIGFKGKTYHLGRYDSFEEAVKAREDGEIKYYGEKRVKTI